METLFVGAIVGFWLLLFVAMAVVPLLSERRTNGGPARVIRLDDHRHDPKRAA